MTTKRSVAAIILHFGDAADTQRCVESVVTAKRAAAGHCSTTIHVVSNGSASQPQFRAEIRSEVSVSSLEKNCGFAAGMNAGIRSAMADEPDYFWLLNNDTLVDSQSLCELVKHAAGHPELKWLGPSIVDAKNDQIISYGGYLYCDALSVALPVKKHGNSADYLDGAAMFLCANALKEIYLIPEKSFLYFEELHLARAFAERGYSWGTCETAFVTHIGGSSTATLGARKKTYYSTYAALEYTWEFSPIFIPSVLFARLTKATLDCVITFNLDPLLGFGSAIISFCFADFRRQR